MVIQVTIGIARNVFSDLNDVNKMISMQIDLRAMCDINISVEKNISILYWMRVGNNGTVADNTR